MWCARRIWGRPKYYCCHAGTSFTKNVSWGGSNPRPPAQREITFPLLSYSEFLLCFPLQMQLFVAVIASLACQARVD